ncbi:TetR/AcrR family transcriptional regulator [Kiloniella sp.]|uniref:TetR/AcrR family transcriptional regulator n=1 Tax=Kiloniella sp. TaxID=1938587 RepID=UPI003A936703
MARPREFDVEVALNNALQVFWTKGYEGTGITDLLEAMQIARGSLYKAFGDKKNLYLSALKQYEKNCIEPAVQLLRGKEVSDGGQRIRMLFETIILVVEDDNDRRGCFLCNTAVDQAPHDPDVRKACQQMMGEMVQGFYCALKDLESLRVQDEEVLKTRAMSLNVAYNGLRVMVKSGYSPSDIRKTSERTLTEFGLL